ncbi:MAG: hypothetical protein FJ150_08300 [Euryarchaeota archaeon]|nr:hypothetical protein [Euryarchaeota archaeon]
MGDIKEIRSIPVVPFALITAAVLAVIMFIVGIIMTIFGGTMLAFLPTQQFGSVLAGGAMMAVVFIIIVPIVYFIIGFIMYAILALIYNVLAPRIGGIKLELE